jgi:4-carboxymuconolactone decarboxylase
MGSRRNIAATVSGCAADPAWSPEQASLIRAAGELHDAATVSDQLWRALAERYSESQLVELVALAGQYHVVCYLANALGVEREEAAARFPSAAAVGAA